jgi:hypothetical protein
MLGLDTYILKQLEKWMSKAKDDKEIISRARIFMGSVLAIHLTLAVLAGWRLYKIIKSKETSASDLVWPIILLAITLVIPYGTERGEELTSIPSSGLLAFATFALSTATIVMWFIYHFKDKPEEEKKEETNL